MTKDQQSRKWNITVNNPLEYGFGHEKIKEELEGIKSTVYYCMADEAGSTHHTHIYVCFSSAVRFSTLKARLPQGHLEIARGTSEQNRDYITKAGKWEHDTKHGTQIPGTFEEYGNMPVERQGQRNDLIDLYDRVKAGASNFDILEETPEHLFHVDKIERARQVVLSEKYRDTFRELEVTYLWGPTNAGKTRHVFEKYGYRSVYRVTDYAHAFDQYQGEDVMVFDEFRSQIPIAAMLTYLEGYPLSLPCRYSNRQACYTKVFLISNITFEQQYIDVRIEQSATWSALRRRIHKVQYFPHPDENKFLQAATKEELDKLMHRGG